MGNAPPVYIFENGLVETDGTVAPDYGSGPNQIAQGDDKRFKRSGLIAVQKDPGAGEFSDLAAAVAEAISRSPSAVAPIDIVVYNGTFTISDTIILPQWVTISGDQGGSIIAITDPTKHAIRLQPNSTLRNITIAGAGADGISNVAAIEMVGNANAGFRTIENVDFANCRKFIDIDTTGGAVNTSIERCGALTDDIFHRGFDFRGTGSGQITIRSTGVLLGDPAATPEEFIFASGANNKISILDCDFSAENAQIDHGIRLQDGVRVDLQRVSFSFCDDAISIENVGAGPTLRGVPVTILSAINLAVEILHPSSVTTLTGTFDADKTSIVSGALGKFAHADDSGNTTGFAVTGELRQGPTETSILSLSDLARRGTTLGLEEGGALTAGVGPLDIDVAAGKGFLTGLDDEVTEVTWTATTLSIPADSQRYITVNTSGVVQAEAALPTNFDDRVILGRVVAANTLIVVIEQSQVNMNHYGNFAERQLREVFGALFASGSLVTENTINARQLDVTAGIYYYGTNRFTPTGGTDVSWVRTYRDGGSDFTTDGPFTAIPDLWDDGSGTLQAIPAGEWVQGWLGIYTFEGEDRYVYFPPQSTHPDRAGALTSDLPLLPDDFLNASVLISGIIFQQGAANIDSFIDIRPRPSFAQTAAASAVNDHGSLTGLLDDDHPQYLPINGTRAMTGNFDLGGNDIINAGVIPGTSTAPPITQTPDNANAEGVSPDKARADHVHNIPTVAPINDQSPNGPNARGNAASFARSDHDHAFVMGTPVTLNPDQANAEGTADSFARSDHIHNVPADVPVTLNPDQANAEGVSTSFARADHVHNVPADVPVNTGTANAEGVSTSFARADHVHQTVITSPFLNQTALFSTTSLTFVPITGFQLTPLAGTYNVDVNMNTFNGGNNNTHWVAVYVDGVLVANSERRIFTGTGNSRQIMSTFTQVTVNGAQVVDVRIRTSANTMNVETRSLRLLRTGP